MQKQLSKSFSAWGRKAIIASLLVATAFFTVACSSSSSSSGGTTPKPNPSSPKLTVLYPAKLATGKKIPITASDVTAKSITVDLNINSFSATAAAAKIKVFLSSNEGAVSTNNVRVGKEISLTAANAKNGIHKVAGVTFRGLGGSTAQGDAIAPAEGTKYYLKAVTIQGSGASEVKNESALVEFTLKTAAAPSIISPTGGADSTPLILQEAHGADYAALKARLTAAQAYKFNWRDASGAGITTEASAYAIGLNWLTRKPTKDTAYTITFNDESLKEIIKYAANPVKQTDLDNTYDLKQEIAKTAQVAFVATTKHADFDLNDPGTFRRLSAVTKYLAGAFTPFPFGLTVDSPKVATVTAKKGEKVNLALSFQSPAPAAMFRANMSNVILYKKDATSTDYAGFSTESSKVTIPVGAAKAYTFTATPPSVQLIAGETYTFTVQTFGRNPFTGQWGSEPVPLVTSSSVFAPKILKVTIPYTVGLALATGANTVTKTTTSLTYTLAEAIDTTLFDVAVKYTIAATAAAVAVPTANTGTAVTSANIAVQGSGADANKKLKISGLTAGKFYKFYITATPKTAPSAYIKPPAALVTTTAIQTSSS